MNSSASPQSIRRVDPWLVAIVLIAAIGGAVIVARARNWALMTDELLYTGMARSIAHSIIPLPQVRGESINFNQVLFPTLIAPIVGSLSMPTAYSVIAVFNAVVFATAAIPAYLLTNLVTANRTAARWVAACTVITPGFAFASKAIPDPLAYVAVLWTAYAFVRTTGDRERPLKGDALTLLAIALTYLVRNQFLLLVGVWVGVVVLRRIAETLDAKSARDIPRELITLLKDRPLPFITFVLVVLIVKLEPSWLLGIYTTVTTEGANSGPAPSGLIHGLLNHASVIGVGLVGLPVILGLPWLLVALGRVNDRIQNGAAIVIVLLSGAVLYVATTFDLRFAPSDQVIERYVFYIAPLMLVAMAAFFDKPPKRFIAFVVPAIAGLLLLNVSQPYGFDSPLGFAVNHGISPTQIALVSWQSVADVIGTSIFGLMTILLILLAGTIWWLIEADRAALAQNLSFAVVLAVLTATAIYTVPKIVNFQNDAIDSALGARSNDGKAWLDVASGGTPTSLVFSPPTTVKKRPKLGESDNTPNPHDQAVDIAFWNQTISAVYVPFGGNPQVISPFPGKAFTMKPDWETGALKRRPDDKAHYLAQTNSNLRFAPQYTGKPIERAGYVMYDTGRQATAAWATEGLTTSGWVPQSGATLRVWAPRLATAPSLVNVNLTVLATDDFKVEGTRGTPVIRREGKLTRYVWAVKLPVGGHADFKLVRGAGKAHVERILSIGPLDSSETLR